MELLTSLGTSSPLLHALQGRCCPQGRQQLHCHHQNQENNPVCRLVSHRLQGWHQLPAPDCGALRGPCQGAQGRLHAQQHHRDRRGLGQARPQVRPDVRQARLRPLVRWGGHGGGRVLRGSRGSCCSREGLRGGWNGIFRGRRRGRRRILERERKQKKQHWQLEIHFNIRSITSKIYFLKVLTNSSK